MKQRLTSFATVALVAALSAAFVAVAPVQAQGMVSDCTRVAAADVRPGRAAAPAVPSVSQAVLSPSWSAVAAEAWRASPATPAAADTSVRPGSPSGA